VVRVSRLMLLAGTALCAPLPATAQAPAPDTLPQGGAVIAGQASIAASAPNRLQVTQGSDRAVIGWQSFSIGSNAAVDIRQPGAGSISVQQVQGNDPSRIFGQLSSNGRVVVANPNGVWFGPEARVDAAGIAAGAGRMSPGAVTQFMADGQVRLDQGAAPGAQVVNEGRITAGRGGLAALVGPTARNAGTIEAKGGRVQVAGAAGATVDFDGDGLIALRAAPGALAENTGRILADGGRVRLTVAEAKGVLAGAVNLGGVVEARSVTADQGGITLGAVHAEGPAVTVTGRVDVSGPRGGTVALLGDEVRVREGARIDASGAAGGGTVRVGGDVRGAPGTRTARTTTVERGATVAADATVAGAGGSVVVWADGLATMDGAIVARGAGAGAGGFVEVSGLGGIAYGGLVDLRAPSGLWGTLLFDPTTINIVASGGTNVIPTPATPGVVDLNASAVVTQLGLSNVELVATSAINVNAAVSWSTAGTLTLTANQINVTSAITLGGAGDLVVAARGNVDVDVSGTLTMNSTGSVRISAFNDVTLRGNVATAPTTGQGSLTVTADSDGNLTGDALLRGDIQLRGGALSVSGATVRVGRTTAGNLSLQTGTGAITLDATNGTLVIGTTAGSDSNTLVASNDGGTVTLKAAGDVLIGRATEAAATGGATWTEVRSPQGAVSIDAGGSVLLRARSGASTPDSFGRVIAGTGLTVTADGDVVVGGGTGVGTAAASAGSLMQTTSGPMTVNATGNVIVQAGGDFAPASVTSGAAQTIAAGGELRVIAARSAAAVSAAGTQTITAGGTIDVTAAGSAARITAAGTQTITAGGAVTLTGGTGPGLAASIANAGGGQAISGQGVVVKANGGEAFIANTGGPQSVTATAGAVTLTAAAGAAATILNAGGGQAVSGTAVALTAAANGPVTIANAGGAQEVTARTGAIGLAAATNAPARITNDGGAQAVTAATTLTLTASGGTGTAAIANGAGGQTVVGRTGITLTGAEAAATITAGDGDQAVRSDGGIRLAASPSGTASGPLNAAIVNGAGAQTVAAGGSLEVLAGGTNAGAAIRSGRDQNVTAGGRIDVLASNASADLTAAGLQSIAAGGAITLAGGTGPGLSASIDNAGGSQAVSGRTIDLAANAGGAAITNRGGNQTVSAAQALGIAGGAGNGVIANDGGDQTVRADTGILLRAADKGGAVGIDNMGGNQTVASGRGPIALLAALGAPAFIGNLGGNQTVEAATSLELIAGGGTPGQAAIFNDGGAQTITAGSDLSLAGGTGGVGGVGGAAFVIALAGPQTVTAGGLLTLTGAPGATPLGLSETAPTAAPTPGSASIQSDPMTPPGVAAGTADQRVSALGVIFAGPPGTSAIGLQDLRAVDDSPTATPRYQSVLSGGAELSVAGSTTVFALTPPPGPPGPPGGGATPEGPLAAAVNALRQILAPTFPRPVVEQLGGGTGGFVPAGLAEGETQETVEIAGEDAAAVFANAVLTTRVDGLLPPPVPYFPGFVSPPPSAATLR
jgi:filamentous hemagglutinin family protein